MTKRQPCFIDLFAGCGGLSLGLMQAGWRGLFAIEKHPTAFSTLQANMLSGEGNARGLGLAWPSALRKEAISIEDILHGEFRAHLKEYEDKVDLVSGGPPCQGFSFSGRRNQKDPRNKMIEAYAEFVLRIRPRLLLVENVLGITVAHGTTAQRRHNPKKLGRPRLSYAMRLAKYLGDKYHFVDGVIDAADYGVPQSRKRYFGVGVLRSLAPHDFAIDGDMRLGGGEDETQSETNPFSILNTIRAQFLLERCLSSKKKVSAREAIDDLDTVETRECTDDESRRGFFEPAYSPPTEKYLSPFARLMRQGCGQDVPDSMRLARHSKEVVERFRSILKNCPRGVRISDDDRELYGTKKYRVVPLDPDRPAHTLTTLPDDLIHYSRPRILTVRECARLQSFPDWYSFKGKYTTGGKARRKECPRYTQVGNAVPPLLAAAWGVALKNLLEDLNDHPGT